MTDSKQWYVLGLAILIIIALGLWWAVTTGHTSALLDTTGNASTTEPM